LLCKPLSFVGGINGYLNKKKPPQRVFLTQSRRHNHLPKTTLACQSVAKPFREVTRFTTFYLALYAMLQHSNLE